MKSLLCSKSEKIEWNDDKKCLLINDIEYIEKDKDGKPVEFTDKQKLQKGHEIKRNYYCKFLSEQFENLCVLTGAGSSFGVGKTNTGKTMAKLWESVNEISDFDLQSFCTSVKYNYSDKNLEELLGQANRAKNFIDTNDSKTQIETGISIIEKSIKKDCTLELPEQEYHSILLNKIANRKLKYPRTRLFTLNYDTLFEQASDKVGCFLIDGFSFTKRRVFRGYAFDYDLVIRERSRIQNEENYVSKVVHLYKLHGSIDWCLKQNEVVQEEAPENPLLIFPAESKYELSYEQPFFEMMSRFQENLRKQNTTLICCGFSLNDKHVRTVIQEAVAYNSSFRVFLIDHDIDSNKHWNWFKNKAKFDSRITVVSEDFNDFAQYFPDQLSLTQEDRLKDYYGRM